MKNPKILMVTHGMPPALTGSSVVIRNLAEQFGTDEMVVAGERWTTSRVPASERAAPPDPTMFHYVWTPPGLPSEKVRRLLRWICFPLILFRLYRLLRRHECNSVLAVYPDEFYLTLGYVLAAITRKPLFSYFHNTYLENPDDKWRPFRFWLQPRVFKASRIVFVMSEGMQLFLQERHPLVQFEPLVHCSGDDAVELPTEFDCNTSQKTDIAFIGNMNGSNKEAFCRFWKAVRDLDVALHLYTSQTKSFYESCGISGDNVSFHRVPAGRERECLRSHDIMFLPHGFTGPLSPAEYLTIFPTKTIPMLLSGRPILAHSPAGVFLTKWLREHQCALVVDQADPSAIRDAVLRLASKVDVRKELVVNAIEAAGMFRADVVAAGFYSRVNSALECGKSSARTTS